MEEHRSAKKVTLMTIAAAAFVFFGIQVQAGQAASIYISPSSGTYSVGQNFTLTVGVSSPGQAVNAISGNITFPADKLEVTSISKSGTVIGLWVQDPSFSNASGTISFEGIILNPGFTGSAGKAVSVSFKTKASGSALVAISSGSVLANDGMGTNIISGLGRATITIAAKESVEPVAVTPTAAEKKEPIVSGKPPAIEITSTSHPDNGSWYSHDTADLQWVLPPGATAVSVYVDQKPDTTPSASSDGLFNSYSTTRLNDGIWYFHLRIKNASGWGPASHFRFQIDTAKPDNFVIKFIDGNETSNTQPTIVFNTADGLSGVDHYEVKVGEDNILVMSAVEVNSNPYILPVQDAGIHRVLVVAYDKAGNHTSTSADFRINLLNKPVIDQYPARLKADNILMVKGTTDYPDTLVRVWIQEGGNPAVDSVVRTNARGAFVYATEGGLRSGVYAVWAQVSAEDGGLSGLSDKVVIIVEEPYFVSIGNRGISLWYLIIPIFGLVALIVGYILYIRNKKVKLQNTVKKSLINSKDYLHHAFNDLRESMAQKLKIAEQARPGKRFTPLEKKMLVDFRKILNDMEKDLEKHFNAIRIPKK